MTTMFNVAVIFLFYCCISCIRSVSKRKVYQKANGDYMMLYKGGYAFDFPDLETIHELGFDEKNASRIPSEIYEVLNIGKPIQSLKQANGLIDEVMRVKIGM